MFFCFCFFKFIKSNSLGFSRKGIQRTNLKNILWKYSLLSILSVWTAVLLYTSKTLINAHEAPLTDSYCNVCQVVYFLVAQHIYFKV